MWTLGHSVRAIEHSRHRLIIEETATTGAVWMFGGLALLALALWITRPRSFKSTLAEEAVGAIAFMYFSFFALWATV
jgi:hypothetical protein